MAKFLNSPSDTCDVLHSIIIVDPTCVDASKMDIFTVRFGHLFKAIDFQIHLS